MLLVSVHFVGQIPNIYCVGYFARRIYRMPHEMSTSIEEEIIGIYKNSLKNIYIHDIFESILRVGVIMLIYQRSQVLKGFSNPWPNAGASWKKMEKYYWK